MATLASAAPATPDDQPVGPAVEGWRPRERPSRAPMHGRHCTLEPLDPARHVDELWQSVSADAVGSLWTYLSYGPFESAAAYRAWIRSFCLGDDPLFFAVVDRSSGRAAGLASYLRIDPSNGVVEVGHLQYSPLLQRTAAATEAMYLMMRRAFSELGYRRYEWKCDALNGPSRRAAERLGFRLEGIFRQAGVYKGRSRDTAWYAALDHEWPRLAAAFEAWLAPSNFDGGRQRSSLASFRT